MVAQLQAFLPEIAFGTYEGEGPYDSDIVFESHGGGNPSSVESTSNAPDQ
jgi:hypothetical protein